MAICLMRLLHFVKVWALHALALIAESGGPMLRGYVEPTLSLALKLLLNVSQSHVDVHQCIGKVVSALITTVGPELQGKYFFINNVTVDFNAHLNDNQVLKMFGFGWKPFQVISFFLAVTYMLA